ncbi:peptidoglycan bridge formation glycyltransferase FemA/FemB family protein [Candidatus Daviesbacteria bacterium]|nr:peptidoglycan bridge formation glycyltransferase FemA/FemB family protein [Candidatus Daviesbacteria bacterium]
MDLRKITNAQKSEYNKLVTHVSQSYEWGEFRKSLGLTLLRYGIFKKDKLTTVFQLTLHKIPLTKQFVGYLPKGPLPDKELAQALEIIGKEHSCAFIKVEPDILAKTPPSPVYPAFLSSPKPLFTKYNYILDLTPATEELLKKMHQKTRYNIKLAQKKGVVVEERTDDKAFEIYLKLYFETTQRQNYHGHNTNYHQKVWQILKKIGMARLLIAFYKPPNSKTRIPLSAWMLLNFKDTLYYPYGGSSLKHKEVMANNLVAWEAIRLGKKMGLKKFDMWGALPPDAPLNHPWQGFNKFKAGFGGELVEYLGTYDLIFIDFLYWAFTTVDKLTSLKVFLLRLLHK